MVCVTEIQRRMRICGVMTIGLTIWLLLRTCTCCVWHVVCMLVIEFYKLDINGDGDGDGDGDCDGDGDVDGD